MARPIPRTTPPIASPMFPRGATGGSVAAGSGAAGGSDEVLGTVAESEEPDTSQAQRTCLVVGAATSRMYLCKNRTFYTCFECSDDE